MSLPLPAEVAKELLHLDCWFDDVDALLARGRETYLADPLLQHAADGLLAKIGEASVRLRDAGWTRERPAIPWRQVIGNRNLIVHGYDVISRARQWVTLEVSVRELHDSLRPDILQARAQTPSGPEPPDEPEWVPPAGSESSS